MMGPLVLTWAIAAAMAAAGVVIVVAWGALTAGFLTALLPVGGGGRRTGPRAPAVAGRARVAGRDTDRVPRSASCRVTAVAIDVANDVPVRLRWLS